MQGHTAFLVTARRMAHGVQAPRKKRRPAPGAYGDDYLGPRRAEKSEDMPGATDSSATDT
jgi:tRNA (adenine57-N1/adenine58-N1)-methyltransferase